MDWRAPLALELLYIPQLIEKAGENNIFRNAYNEMPCTATDNVFQKKTVNGCSDAGEEDQKQWYDFLSAVYNI